MGPEKVRILVVDREVSVAETLVLVLNTGGFDATAAFSSDQAIAKVKEGLFDVLLTDVVMDPVDMNGIQLALAILELQPSIRVILFSGSDDASPILVEAAQAGHRFPLLAKPLHPEELFSHLRNGGPPEKHEVNPELEPPAAKTERLAKPPLSD